MENKMLIAASKPNSFFVKKAQNSAILDAMDIDSGRDLPQAPGEPKETYTDEDRRTEEYSEDSESEMMKSIHFQNINLAADIEKLSHAFDANPDIDSIYPGYDHVVADLFRDLHSYMEKFNTFKNRYEKQEFMHQTPVSQSDTPTEIAWNEQ